MPMAVWERHEVAGGKSNALTFPKLDVGPAFAEEMVDDHVSGFLREHGRERPRLRRCETPRLGEFHVEVDGRVESDGAKDFRKGVHRNAESSICLSGVFAKNTERWVKPG